MSNPTPPSIEDLLQLCQEVAAAADEEIREGRKR